MTTLTKFSFITCVLLDDDSNSQSYRPSLFTFKNLNVKEAKVSLC